MGQGGQLVLVNGTPYVWELIDQNFHQMEWEFKRDAHEVKPGQALSVYVEAKARLFMTKSDDSGNATYLIRGAPQPHQFEIQARYLDLQVTFKNFGTQNNPPGTTISLGLISDRPSYFVLSGYDGGYHSVNTATDWMQANLKNLGTRSLRQLCLPYSHDAGMSIVPYSTALASSFSILTQLRNVGQQLQLGIRMFDIRPHLFEGRFVCGHYSYIDKLGSWQGGNGEDISAIIREINQFTESNKELVILELKLAYNIHADRSGRDRFTNFDESEWYRLLDQLTGSGGIKDLYVTSQAAVSLDLTSVPLNDFIGRGEAAVVLVIDADVNLGKYGNRGCFKKSQLPTNGGGVNEMRQKRTSAGDEAFIYWGTHTQSDMEAVLSTLGQSSSGVIALAKQPKDDMFRQLFPSCTKQCYPNIIAADAIDSTDFTALALAINDLN